MKVCTTKLLTELENAGFPYASINDIYHQVELPERVVKIALKWLPAIYEEHLGSGDQLVRSLMSSKEPFDPAVLIQLFEKSNYNFSVKSGIAFTLAYAKTVDISEWLKRQLLLEEQSKSRYGLIAALPEKGGFKTRVEFMDFLGEIFDKYPTDILLSLYKKFGEKADIPFLENKAPSAGKKLAREIFKVIDSINKRKKNFKYPIEPPHVKGISESTGVFSVKPKVNK